MQQISFDIFYFWSSPKEFLLLEGYSDPVTDLTYILTCYGAREVIAFADGPGTMYYGSLGAFQT